MSGAPGNAPRDAPEEAPGDRLAVPLIEPRIEREVGLSARLEPEPMVLALTPRRRRGAPALALAGLTVLALGFALLGAGNFVADQFARGPVLGWLTLAVAVAGFGLLFVGIARELRGLLALRSVDRLRAELLGQDAGRRVRAARRWVAGLPDAAEHAGLLAAIDSANDPDAVLALLSAGPGASLTARSDALGRVAAVQLVAGLAATPSPSLAVLLVSWRGLRLLRQVAELHGLRPGLLGTLALVRRTVLAATAVAATEILGNAAAHALLSNPLLAHLAGEMAGAGVGARRMMVLARAAATACSPLSRR